MRRSTAAVVVVVIIILLIVGVVVARHKSNQPASSSNQTNSTPTPVSQPSQQPTNTPGGSTSSESANVDYTDNGFSPAAVTIKSGGTLTFVNKTSDTIQVDSDPHPEHTDDTDLNVGTIAPGQSKSVKVSKTGTFGIHNHLSPSVQGTVTVQ